MHQFGNQIRGRNQAAVLRERLDPGRQRLMAHMDFNPLDNTIGHYLRHAVLTGNPRVDPGIRSHPSSVVTLGLHIMIPVAELNDPPMDYQLTNVQIFGEASRYEMWQVTHLRPGSVAGDEFEIQRVLRVQPRDMQSANLPRVWSVTDGEIRRAVLPTTAVVAPTAEFLEMLRGMAQEEQAVGGAMVPHGVLPGPTG